MINFFSKYKFIFYLYNLILISLYLFPCSILGLIINKNCKLQPQLTTDFVVSTNHLFAFLILSLIGFFTYKKLDKTRKLSIYLIIISIILEITHHFIPERSFEYSDLFGNLSGVIIIIILFNIFKKYENLKN
tara:strand:+ start:56 stop:451 length:396 start_codon:yes stop_codon:yes gene_type:complete